MKQRITCDDLAQLSEEQKQRLREWWKPEPGDHAVYTRYKNTVCMVLNINDKYFSLTGFGESNQFWSALNDKEDCLPLLSIRQMIELLQEKHGEDWIDRIYSVDYDHNIYSLYDGEFADALWAEVKEVL